MIDPLYRSHTRFPSLRSCLLALTLILPASIASALEPPLDDGIQRDLDPALGISDDFGRWNGPIRLVYDPDGAPPAFSDNNKLLALLREAYSYWMQVSGVRFEIVGVDASARDDRNASPFQRDGLVRVSWENLGGAAGQAGPTGNFFDRDLGYFPYDDGSLELNRNPGVIASDFELVSVLVHELGHLLGLGHSDVPGSIMYANPYNNLSYPRADDIRAMQVLYGPPAEPLDPDQPVAAWRYSPPPQAEASATQFLFTANAHPNSRNGAYFRVGDEVVASVTAAADDNEFLWFFGALGGGSAAIDLDTEFVIVDPAGYVYDRREWRLACSARSSCVSYTTVGEVAALKTVPGTWTVYIVDRAANRTLGSASIAVSGAPVVNRAPAASISAVATGPAQARFTITVSDPDGDAVDVVWHPPGLSGRATDVRQRLASGSSASLDVDFSQAGTHTFFVELRDTGPRYGKGPNASLAGEGFQTLLRVTATLPGAAVQVVSTQDSGSVSNPAPSKQVLAAIATTPNPMLVANANGTNAVSKAPASFTYGASANGGVSTGTTFRSGDNVIIAGGVHPQPADVGKAADVFIVVRTTLNGSDTWTYRNTSGVFVPWPSVSIAQLQPAYKVASLQVSEAFEIHNGSLAAAQHRVYIGYRPHGSNTLLYTGEALRLNVGN